MHPDERPTVSLAEARRRSRRAGLICLVGLVAYVALKMVGWAPWWASGALAIVMGWFALSSERWQGYIKGRQAADLDYWRRQREGRL